MTVSVWSLAWTLLVSVAPARNRGARRKQFGESLTKEQTEVWARWRETAGMGRHLGDGNSWRPFPSRAWRGKGRMERRSRPPCEAEAWGGWGEAAESPPRSTRRAGAAPRPRPRRCRPRGRPWSAGRADVPGPWETGSSCSLNFFSNRNRCRYHRKEPRPF